MAVDPRLMATRVRLEACPQRILSRVLLWPLVDHFAQHIALPTAVANNRIKLNLLLIKPTDKMNSYCVLAKVNLQH